MLPRKVFSEQEKRHLQQLIIKYKLNFTSTSCNRSIAEKKMAWARLVEDYNAVEPIKRTESQLKKCWDNMKTRKKALIALKKKERLKTDTLVSESNSNNSDGTNYKQEHTDDNATSEFVEVGMLDLHPDTQIDQRHQAISSKRIRTKVINEEFNIRKRGYERSQERKEELHQLLVAEKKWLVKAAEEKYKTAVIERESAEECLRCNRSKREAAELMKNQLN